MIVYTLAVNNADNNIQNNLNKNLGILKMMTFFKSNLFSVKTKVA